MIYVLVRRSWITLSKIDQYALFHGQGYCMAKATLHHCLSVRLEQVSTIPTSSACSPGRRRGISAASLADHFFVFFSIFSALLLDRCTAPEPPLAHYGPTTSLQRVIKRLAFFQALKSIESPGFRPVKMGGAALPTSSIRRAEVKSISRSTDYEIIDDIVKYWLTKLLNNQ